VSAVLASLGCGGNDSASSDRHGDPSQTSAATKPVVTKKYREDILSDQDADAPDYRYWDYTFEFGDRSYLARVYTDEPEVAYVSPLGADGEAMEEVGALKLRDPVERANLRTMRRHLTQDGWPRIVIHTLGEEGYKPLRLP
jgi:hypothetical protein